MELNDITGAVIGAAVEVHRAFGPGLLEGAYAAALAREMELCGLRYRKELPIEATYKGRPVGVAYRADFLVEDVLLVELKAVDIILPEHRAQLLSYLRLANHQLGLLVNFHATSLTRGVYRVVNNL